MNDMQIFNNPDFGTVRTLDDDGMILFVHLTLQLLWAMLARRTQLLLIARGR